jgi:hypothetical protein
MFSETDHTRPTITFDQMQTFLETGWGPVGLRVAKHWAEFNDRFFGGQIEPTPIVITQTSPHGHWSGLTCGSGSQKRANLIYLALPSQGCQLTADRGVLLHEMLHAFLMQQGLDPHHDGQPWRNGITRLSQIAGRTIVAMPVKVGKTKDRKSIRIVAKGSLTQKEISQWPHSAGIDFGRL